MLQTYTEIDERVRTLGYVMKVFAKVIDSLQISHAFLIFSYMSCVSVVVFCKSCDVFKSEASGYAFFS